MRSETPALVLASGSITRRTLLEAAGVPFVVRPADVDESAIRDALLADNPGLAHGQIAEALAVAKALVVSDHMPGHIVIGSDQVLSCDGRLFEKARSLAEARACLLDLRGKTHTLHAAVALALNGEILWQHLEPADLTLRPFSEEALDAYLAKVGTKVLTSVGAYQIEGPALQLFERIDGDHTTILGLPLLPLLSELIDRQVLLR
jgi:septum formation protein